MADEEPVSRCPVHGGAATGICARCGCFGCDGCLRPEGEVALCGDCLARPAVRLRPSPRAKRALVLALLGFHGLVVLLPVAAYLAREELAAISAGESVPAGRPFVQGALALAVAGMVLWAALVIAWMELPA